MFQEILQNKIEENQILFELNEKYVKGINKITSHLSEWEFVIERIIKFAHENQLETIENYFKKWKSKLTINDQFTDVPQLIKGKKYRNSEMFIR